MCMCIMCNVHCIIVLFSYYAKAVCNNKRKSWLYELFMFTRNVKNNSYNISIEITVLKYPLPFCTTLRQQKSY